MGRERGEESTVLMVAILLAFAGRSAWDESRSEHRFPAPSSKVKGVANQCLEHGPMHIKVHGLAFGVT